MSALSHTHGTPDPVSPNRLTALAALGEPVRRELYRMVAADGPLTRDEAATGIGIPRSTAAFHLDRLADAGLLHVEYRRREGRAGPGAGRPAKVYEAASADLQASIPERHYELAGELLASAIERAEAEHVPLREALDAEAQTIGAGIGAASEGLDHALSACGYAPVHDGAGGVLLDNCPFHALAASHTALVCTANVALVRGLAEGAGDSREAVLQPRVGHCCVAIRPLTAASSDGE